MAIVCSSNGVQFTDGTASFDVGTNTTTFAWTICANPPTGPCHQAIPPPALGHTTIDLSGLAGCGGAAIVSAVPTPADDKDPPCFGQTNLSVVKWDTPLQGGSACSSSSVTLTLVLTGQFNTGLVPVGTKAGDACAITQIPGPVCP